MKEITLSVTEAARNFADVVNRAYYRHETTVLLKNGAPVAKIVPISPHSQTTHELARIWPTLPHLTPEEAEAYENDIKEGYKILIPPEPPKWE